MMLESEPDLQMRNKNFGNSVPMKTGSPKTDYFWWFFDNFASRDLVANIFGMKHDMNSEW